MHNQKTIYARDPKLWAEVVARAKAEDVSVSSLVERALKLLLRPKLIPLE